MRNLPDGLQQHLRSGATTMCNCWIVKRRDGYRSGFTDHDRRLDINGVSCEAVAGFESTELEAHLGFGVGGSEVAGVLDAESISEAALSNGAYDGAEVEIWRVNWSDPEQRVLIDVATIGEVRRGPNVFTAELRSLAHRLDQERGLLFQSSCSASLGDPKCRANLSAPAFQAETTIKEILDPLRFSIKLGMYESGWFTGGRIEYLNGANVGAWQTIESYHCDGVVSIVGLWRAPAAALTPGSTVKLHAGCDKSFSTCGNKFANIQNFRGFPHIPGGDAMLTHPGSADGPMDGGSIYR
ncbi:MAG: DUF2163 domain-containing protein [Beijerinckiaceae bacterium]